mmetsp:Transcript_15732/g.43455  ORF Transcript_15732/g.43455 Transcript_15732/m.43455 type:complete len:215 (+) Transcript_15732:18-662(+)
MARLSVGDGIEFFLVEAVDVAHVAQPLLERGDVVEIILGGAHATAFVVAADDDILDLEVANAVLQGAHEVGVGVDDEIGDIAVHEDVAWLLAHDEVGWDAGIDGSDVHVIGSMRGSKLLEELGILLEHFLLPCLILVEDVVQSSVVEDERRHGWSSRWRNGLGLLDDGGALAAEQTTQQSVARLGSQQDGEDGHNLHDVLLGDAVVLVTTKRLF